MTALAVDALPYVADCAHVDGRISPFAPFLGCRCADASRPTLALAADGKSGSCESACAHPHWLCHGRGRAHGVVFCAATNLATAGHDTLAGRCTRLPAGRSVLLHDVARATFARHFPFDTQAAVSYQDGALHVGTDG